MTTSSIGGASGMSSTHFAQMREQRFKSLDTDGSGDINETEFAAGPSGSGGMDSDIASALFQAFDTDSSGGLSQSELETGFQKMSSSMRSVLVGTQEANGSTDSSGGFGGPGGSGGPDGPPPPPAGAGASNSDTGLDQLLSLLQGADGNDASDDGSDSSSADSSSDSTTGYAAVKSDLKQLLNDLAKLTQSNSVGTQVTV